MLNDLQDQLKEEKNKAEEATKFRYLYFVYLMYVILRLHFFLDLTYTVTRDLHNNDL